MTPPRIELKSSPHMKQASSVDQIMRNVCWALLPVCGFAVYNFGVSALAVLITTTIACVLTEQLFNSLAHKPSTLGDYSAVITGMLLALTLPPAFPLWMAALAGVIAISLGKMLFGGLGFNPFNPALIGRAFTTAAFPEASSTWTQAGLAERFTDFLPSTLAVPFTTPASVDAYTTATPLTAWKFRDIHPQPWELFTGMASGSLGETSALIILLGGIYLIARRMLDWRIPAAVLGGAFLTAAPFYGIDPQHYPTPWVVLLSGGMMLGAVFMASDMSSSPVTPAGVWIYGLLIGFLAVIIRFFGGMPEGVMYAILLGNALVPLIERYTQPRTYGKRNRRGV